MPGPTVDDFIDDEGSRFAKDLIPFLTGVRLAAAQQMLVGLLLVVLMIRRPEGLLPEVLGDGRATTGSTTSTP